MAISSGIPEISGDCRTSGAPRSESKIHMVAGGNRTAANADWFAMTVNNENDRNKSRQPLAVSSGPESPLDRKTPAVSSVFYRYPLVAADDQSCPGLPYPAHLHIVYHTFPKKYTTFFVHNSTEKAASAFGSRRGCCVTGNGERICSIARHSTGTAFRPQRRRAAPRRRGNWTGHFPREAATDPHWL